MSEIKIPSGYQRVMPYLIIRGATEFLAFTKAVFQAEEIMKHWRSEGVIMHAEIRIGESVIMFADATEEHSVENAGFFVYVANADASYELALQNGATAKTPMGDQEYGRSGGVIDPFGNTWWITSVAGMSGK